MAIDVNVRKSLGSFSLDVAFSSKGGIVGLLGASGSGKSKTLQCIAGIERPDEGRVAVNGKPLFDSGSYIDMPVQKRRVGYLFQDYALFPNMTVEENINYSIRKGRSKAERTAAIASMVNRLRLDGLERNKPAQLSGGQQQRVALARILVNEPEVLLLDEPFSALDSYLKEKLMIELSETLAQFRKDVVLVTHSRDEAYQLCDSLAILSDGKLEVFGETKAVFAQPRTRAAAVLTGCKNVVAARKDGDCTARIPEWGITVTAAEPVGDTLCAVGIRAHSFKGGERSNSFAVRFVEEIEQPFEWVLKFRYDGQQDKSPAIWWRFPKDRYPRDIPSCLGVAPEDILLLYK